MAETGCQSVMIGRGALGRPWVFSEAFDTLPPSAGQAAKFHVITRHVALIREHFPDNYALIQMKKHLAWYTEGLAHGRHCRVALFQSRTPDEAWSIFQDCWAAAPQTDPAESLALAAS
jgi:tRNA-dihydrouridine synthase